MTDIISNIKIQKPLPISTRRVSLQQNPNNEHTASSNNNQLSTNFLLSNNNVLPISNYVLPSAEPLSSFYKPTNQHELMLKPSLKLHKNTPTITKSVRFNMPLVQILHFYTPSAIEEDTYDDYDEEVEEDDYEEEDGDYYADEQDEEEENELEDAFLELFSKRLSSCSDYDSSLYHPTIQQHILDSSLDNTLVLKLPNWPAVNPSKRSVTQMVSLESLSWENARSIIKGRVLVRNVAFEKLVTIRMSFNHWQTWIDVDARYEESSEDDTLDRFVFELVTPNHLSYMNLINSDSHCSLAVRYQVNGAEYWDNNSGNNFSLQWSSPCGYGDMIGEKQENVNTMMTRGNQVISLFQQGKCPTAAMAFYQEDSMEFQKEEYYATIITDGHPAYNNVYIASPLNMNEKQDTLDCAFGTSTQYEISVHFQLYLDRKKHYEERQYDYPRLRSVADHDVKPMPVSLTPSSQLLIPPGRTELVLT